MKKVLFKSLSVFLAIVLLAAQSQSLSAKTIDLGLPSIDESVFNLDENALNLAMQDLNKLENYLTQNEGVTYDALATVGSDLITNVSDNSAPMGLAQEGGSPLGISAFLWGCVLGWVGLLLVYIITDNDKAQVKKALTGCLVGTAIYVAVYVVYIVWLVEETSTITY